MKKFVSILLALVLVLSLAACGAQTETPAATEAPAVDATEAPAAEEPAAEEPAAENIAWPEKPVTIIVPFNNGGDSDFNARVLTTYLQEELGQVFVIENISGSGGSIGSTEAANAEPDGYTILSNHNSLQISHASGLTETSMDDFEIVGMYAQNPGDVVAVSAASGITNMDELVAASKEKKLSVATNIGATTQVESFMMGEYADLVQVDVGAVSDKIVALLGGQVDIIIGPYGNIAPYAETGDFNIIGVCTPERAPGYPDIPTLKEQGYDVVWQTSFFMGFPKGTDQAIVDKFTAALKKIVTTNEDYANAIMESYYETPVWHDKDEALAMYAEAEEILSQYTLTSLG